MKLKRKNDNRPSDDGERPEEEKNRRTRRMNMNIDEEMMKKNEEMT